MKNKRNKASIVLDLLTNVSSFDDSTPMQKAWSQVLECDYGDLNRISSGPATVIKILKDIEVDLKNIGHIRDLNVYYNPLRTIINAIFGTNYGDNVKTFRDKINKHIPGLSICSDILNSNNINEETISKDEIAELRKQSEELIEEIFTSGIDEDAKTIFIEILNKFRDATIEYQLRGATVFKEAFSEGVGSLVIKSSILNIFEPDSKEKNLGNKLIQYMEKVNTIIGFVSNTQIGIPFFEEMIKKIA